MELVKTPALQIQTANLGSVNVTPVLMKSAPLGVKTRAWLEFLKQDGEKIPVPKTEAFRLAHYMSTHGTDAVTIDGTKAFTVAGNFLMECQPEVFERRELCEA